VWEFEEESEYIGKARSFGAARCELSQKLGWECPAQRMRQKSWRTEVVSGEAWAGLMKTIKNREVRKKNVRTGKGIAGSAKALTRKNGWNPVE